MTWMTAVRDHPDRPAAMQRHVLLCLALRMDWRTGTGWASALQLAADAGASEHTARRATVWARHPCSCGGAECSEHGLLHRTSRGHRRGDGTAAASGWQLIIPPQPATPGRLRPSQPASGAVSTGQRPASLPASGDGPSRTGSSRPSSSAARGRASADGARAGAPGRITAPPCPECGQPYPQELLTDPAYRQLAMAGDLPCPACEATP